MRHLSSAARAASLTLTAAFLACSKGDGGTAPVAPASVANATSGAITGTVGAALTTSPTFVVRDASGNSLSNVTVTVAVSAGGGTLVGAPTKSSGGPTPVGTWTLGNIAGTNTLTITVSGLSTPLTISATGTADVPTQINAVLGTAQSAVAGATLPTPVSFKVGDKFNNGVAGVVVSFSVVAGGGSLPAGSASVTTDAAGVAASPAWTLGKTVIPQTLRAIAGTLTGTASATVSTNFAIEVRFYGPAMEPAIQSAFATAASRIQAMVTGDLVNQLTIASLSDLASCNISGTGVTAVNETIDDIVVYASVATLGAGILGSAGPCFLRPAGGASASMPVLGVMQFSTTFIQTLLADGRLTDVITHEMLHTLGVGTMWSTFGQVSGSGTPSVAFVGQQAVAGCIFHGGTAANQCGSSTVPVEAVGGSGTANVHWRENTSATGVGLNTELMTGTSEAAGVPMPLSRITIGSLADIGFVVNLLPADAFTYPSTASAALSQIRGGQGLGKLLLNEILHGPIGVLDHTGRVTLFKTRQ